MEYQTKTDLILPFKGEWMVSNGGRTAETNSHLHPDGKGPENQSYAYDFRRGHTGEGKDLTDYEVFGREVISPGDGIISQVLDGSRDVEIGERDRFMVFGNAVIIDHQNGEWSVLCHFKYDSIKVKVGDIVKKGDLLGLCGNSGNTSEPHIHFHLQNDAFAHLAKGLPAQFRRIKVNGEIKENYEPVRSQVVENP